MSLEHRWLNLDHWHPQFYFDVKLKQSKSSLQKGFAWHQKFTFLCQQMCGVFAEFSILIAEWSGIFGFTALADKNVSVSVLFSLFCFLMHRYFVFFCRIYYGSHATNWVFFVSCVLCTLIFHWKMAIFPHESFDACLTEWFLSVSGRIQRKRLMKTSPL